MKNSSSGPVSSAASIEVGGPGPTLVRGKDVRGQEAEVFENQGTEATYYRTEQTIGSSNIQSSH